MAGHPRKKKSRWDEPGPCSELLPWPSTKDMADHPRKKRTRWEETGPCLELLPWSSTKDTAGHPPKKKTRWDQPRTNPEFLPWPVPWFDATIHRDILPNIFIRLPATTLLELRYVCKLWHEIISDPSFVYSHSERHRSNKNDDAMQLIIIPRNSNVPRTTNEIALYSYKMDGYSAHLLCRQWFDEAEPYNLTRPYFCHGLFFIIHNFSHMVVCNPITKESFTLPEGSPDESGLHTVRVGFGFDSTRKEYKVAQYFYRAYDLANGTFSIGMEVFTVGTDDQWRVLDEDPPYPLSGKKPACVDGKIYWQIDHGLHPFFDQPQEAILCFDLQDESYSVISAPPCFTDLLQFHMTRLQELGGALCLLRRYRHGNADNHLLDIWMYAPCSKASSNSPWTLGFRFDFYGEIRAVPIAVRHGKLLLRISDGRLMCYDPRKESFEGVEDLAKDLIYFGNGICPYRFPYDSLFEVIPYMESLESLLPVRRVKYL